MILRTQRGALKVILLNGNQGATARTDMIFWVSKCEPFSNMCFLFCLPLNFIVICDMIQKWKHPYHNSYQSFFSSPLFPCLLAPGKIFQTSLISIQDLPLHSRQPLETYVSSGYLECKGHNSHFLSPHIISILSSRTRDDVSLLPLFPLSLYPNTSSLSYLTLSSDIHQH